MQENPPPYNADKKPIVIGAQVPVSKQKQASKAAPKKAAGKKGEKPVLFEALPGPEPVPHYKIMFEYHRELMNKGEIFDFEKGVMSDIEVDPVLLKEILYPEMLPNEHIVM